MNDLAWRHYFSIITMATFNMERPTYGYLILSLDSFISCLIFLLIPHGISPVVWTFGMWTALRLLAATATAIAIFMVNINTVDWAFPGRMAILALATTVSDFLAFAVYYYAPLQSILVEEYLVYGVASWFVLKGLVLLGIAIYKTCKDIKRSEKMDQDRSVYEQLL